MKATVNNLLDSYIDYNAEYLIKNDSNVAEFIIADVEALDDGWLWFLSDEEIAEYKNSEKQRSKMISEIRKYIYENYNYQYAI